MTDATRPLRISSLALTLCFALTAADLDAQSRDEFYWLGEILPL